MCGRYSFFTPIEEAEQLLDAKALKGVKIYPRYNAAPTQDLPVVSNEFPDVIQLFHWGLVPKWAKDISIGNKMINTRSESIAEKPMFRNIFKYKRCLVLADGFYEWKKVGKNKIPYRIHLPNNEIMLLGGLWDAWTDPKGNVLHSYSIITTNANKDVQHLHDRMPVILNLKQAKSWLDPNADPEKLMKYLKPAPANLLKNYAVSTKMNKAAYEDPNIIDPVEEPGELF